MQCRGLSICSHHLILRHSHRLIFNRSVVVLLAKVAYVGKSQWPTAILISAELGNRCVCTINRLKLDNASSARSAARLVLNLCLINFSDSLE